MLVGFVVMAIFTILISFVTTHIWWVWALIFFGTRLGATAVQVMTDSYFFKHVETSNEVAVSIFRDANPLAYIIAPLVATLILVNFKVPLQYFFIILGLAVLLGLRYGMSLRSPR
jgi:MFS family permease